MSNRLSMLLAALFVLVIAGVSSAQGAPDAIAAAINDLGSRVGQADLQRSDLDRWTWEQRTFANAGLGCPDPDQVYAQQQIVGYIFYLTYNDTQYEYHVSSDQTIVRLCEQSATAEATNPVTDSDEPFSNPLCPPPGDDVPPYPRSRVAPDTQASGVLQVNRLRESPSTDAAILTDIPANAIFTVLTGPQCDDDGIVWWQVDLDGTVGWTAEALQDERYIQPQLPNPLPAREIITPENAAGVRLLARLQGNLLPEIAFSPDGTLLSAAGDTGSNSVNLYSIDDIASPPRYLDDDESLTSLDFHPDGTQVLIGTTNGTTHLWNIAPDAPLLEALFLNTHVEDVLAARVSPDGTRFASAGTDAQVTNLEQYDRSYAIILWDIADVTQIAVYDDATAPVVDMAFSPDGMQLAAVASDGSLYIWSVDAPESPTIFSDADARSLAYSPNGQFLAVGTLGGNVRLIDPATGDDITQITGHLGLITAVTFSPDSSIIATISGDGTLRLWSTQTDENLGIIEVVTGTDENLLDIDFSPQGDLIAIATDDNRIDLYGITPGN